VTDNVNPDHYKFNGFELIQLTEQLNFNRGNVIKYVARAGEKDLDTEYEDLQKASWYLGRELFRLSQLWNPEQPATPDASGWVNPPTYEVVDLDAPQEFWSLGLVPPGVVVRDKDGDFWKIKRNGKLRSRDRRATKWKKANHSGYPLSTWDSFAPFIEVKDSK
jgi:hypothetical protein